MKERIWILVELIPGRLGEERIPEEIIKD